MALRVTSGSGCGAALLWALALGWCTFVAALMTRADAIVPGAWIALAIFALAGLYLVALAIRATASASRFRGAAIELLTDPGVLGGKLEGVVHLRANTPAQLTLSNWNQNNDEESLLWESPARTVEGAFSFDVPFDCQPTSSGATWRLVLADDSHAVSFTVPVMQTAASSPAQTQRALRAARYDAPAVTKVKVEHGYAGTTVRLPLPSWLWHWYAFAVLVGAAAYLYSMIEIGGAVVIVLSVIPLPTLAMTVRRIDAGPGGLTLRYVLPRATRLAPADVGAAYDNGALHYELTFGGAVRSWTIITLRSRAEAEWVAYELRLAQGR